MTPTSKQVDEISEVLAILMEDFIEETPQGAGATEPEGAELVSEEVLAGILAKSLAAKGGEPDLREFLQAAGGLLRISLEVV